MVPPPRPLGAQTQFRTLSTKGSDKAISQWLCELAPPPPRPGPARPGPTGGNSAANSGDDGRWRADRGEPLWTLNYWRQWDWEVSLRASIENAWNNHSKHAALLRSRVACHKFTYLHNLQSYENGWPTIGYCLSPWATVRSFSVQWQNGPEMDQNNNILLLNTYCTNTILI